VWCTAQSITLWASIQHDLIGMVFEQTIAYLYSGLMVPCVESSLHVRFLNEPPSISEFLSCSRILSLHRLQDDRHRREYLCFAIGHEMAVVVERVPVERVVKAGIWASHTSVGDRLRSRGGPCTVSTSNCVARPAPVQRLVPRSRVGWSSEAAK